MAGEEMAREILERVLGQFTVVNDDGRVDSMYDLRIGPSDKPLIAIEVVGAVDQKFTETWNVGPSRGPFKLTVQGDWSITIKPGAHIKTLKKRIEPILQKLEAQGNLDARVDFRLEHDEKPIFDELESLDIEHVVCHCPEGSGKIYLWIGGTGGGIDYQGSEVPKWVGKFLHEPAQEDVVHKLKLSSASSCHAFVILSYRGAPWSVESYFTTELEHLPNEAPNLPKPISEVWLVHPWNSRGIHWDGSSWQRFDARKDSAD
jgi:hypothetical protein